MALSKAIFAAGTFVMVDDGIGNYTAIGEIRDIEALKLSRAELDVSHQGSPNGYVETRGARRDPGSYSFDIAFDPADPTHDEQTGLLALFETDPNRNYRLLLPQSLGHVTVPGFIKEFGGSFNLGDVMLASVEIRLSGKPTYAFI